MRTDGRRARRGALEAAGRQGNGIHWQSQHRPIGALASTQQRQGRCTIPPTRGPSSRGCAGRRPRLARGQRPQCEAGASASQAGSSGAGGGRHLARQLQGVCRVRTAELQCHEGWALCVEQHAPPVQPLLDLKAILWSPERKGAVGWRVRQARGWGKLDCEERGAVPWSGTARDGRWCACCGSQQ